MLDLKPSLRQLDVDYSEDDPNAQLISSPKRNLPTDSPKRTEIKRPQRVSLPLESFLNDDGCEFLP